MEMQEDIVASEAVEATAQKMREVNKSFDYCSVVQQRKRQYPEEKLKTPLTVREVKDLDSEPVYVGAPLNYWVIVDAKGKVKKNRIISATVMIEGKLATLSPAPNMYLIPNKEDKWSGSIEFVKPEGGEKE